jgi:hypothetical protein
MDFNSTRISVDSSFFDFDQPTMNNSKCINRRANSKMTEQTPNQHNRHVKPKYLNVLLWVIIAAIAALVGAWTIWANQQPEVRSIWGSK